MIYINIKRQKQVLKSNVWSSHDSYVTEKYKSDNAQIIAFKVILA